MRVRIGDYYLAGDPEANELEHTQAASVTFGSMRMSDEVTGVQWQTARQHDRANDAETISFTTTRLFATAAEAEAWAMAYLIAPPHDFTGDVFFRVGDEERVMIDAVIEPPEIDCSLGATLHLSYRIKGPVLVPAVHPHAILTEGGDWLATEAGDVITQEF